MTVKALFATAVIVLAGTIVVSGYAYRSPTKAERARIVAAILDYQRRHDCVSTHTCHPHISRFRISLANTTYATAVTYDANVGYALALLRKKYGTWRVTDLGSADVGCGGKAPKAVRVDLELTCPGGK